MPSVVTKTNFQIWIWKSEIMFTATVQIFSSVAVPFKITNLEIFSEAFLPFTSIQVLWCVTLVTRQVISGFWIFDLLVMSQVELHRPFSISVTLLISVSHMVLFLQGVYCLQFHVEFGLQPPPAVHGFHHTNHVVKIEFLNSQQLHWLSRMDEIWGLKNHE
jgi:hypothetical protein